MHTLIRRAILAALVASAPAVFAQTPAATSKTGPAPSAASDEDISYALGLLNGERMRHDGITHEISIDTMARGLRDGLAGKSTTPAQQKNLAAFYRGLGDALLTRNHAAALAFLARNGKAKGVSTTASGLQYSIERPGDLKAELPKPTDRVIIKYQGALSDGTVFDSSYERGQPASFQVAGVIKGLQEALALMRPGSKWRIFIPPELAYGDQAAGNIPPGSLLIFDVELQSVIAGPPPGAGAPPH
jgi:FKBP-type peptidyl-prolyl cis-trans isomerase FklB